MKMSDKVKQKLMGVFMIIVSIVFAMIFREQYEGWFLILGGIIPGIYAIFTKKMIFVF